MRTRKAPKKRRSRHLFPRLSLPVTPYPLAWIGGGWVLSFVCLLAFLDFHPVFKPADTMSAPGWLLGFHLALGVALMAYGYRNLPPNGGPDLGRKAAAAWMALILAAGAFLRLYHLNQAPGQFWDDWATNMVWVHHILDMNQFYWMMPSDGIEPFHPWVLTGFRTLAPDGVTDLAVQRMSSCSVDLLALWVLYLAGKELDSRRTGLLAAALGALGRPLIQLTVTGMRAYTLSLAVGFLALASLKLMRKPSLAHFLLWGFALAFGTHTYSSFRCMMMAVPFLFLPWVLRKPGRGPALAAAGLGGAVAVLLLLGIYSGTFAGTYAGFEGWASLWQGWTQQPWIIAGLFGLCLLPSALSAWPREKGGEVPRLGGWALALGLACLMVYPLTLSSQFNERIADLSPFRGNLGADSLPVFLARQAGSTFRALFFHCLDRGDLQIGANPFYDLFSQGALVLGLAFLIARPDWKKALLAALGALGVVVYLISVDPASTKLIGSAPALYLLAAWALSRLWSGLDPRPSRSRPGSLALTALFFLYSAAGAWEQFQMIHVHWALRPNNDEELARNIAQDESRYRVYVAPSDWFFGWGAQFVLNEGDRYYLLGNSNDVPVQEGKDPPDLAVFVYGDNAPFFQSLCRMFPSAQWKKIFIAYHEGQDSNPDLYMWRVVIPGKAIPSDPKALLHLAREEGPWVRRYYSDHFGWRSPGIVREERVARFSDPPPLSWIDSTILPNQSHPRLARFLGPLQVDRKGKTEWSVRFQGPIWIKIDGETACKEDVPPPEGRSSFSADLGPGEHELEVRFRIPFGDPVPEIRWREAGGGAEKEL